MAGLLDGGYTPDPLAQGLLGLGSALLTPRQLGGGLMAGANAFTQGATQAAMLRRQMAQDAMREKLYGAQIKKFEQDSEVDAMKAAQLKAELARQERIRQRLGQDGGMPSPGDAAPTVGMPSPAAAAPTMEMPPALGFGGGTFAPGGPRDTTTVPSFGLPSQQQSAPTGGARPSRLNAYNQYMRYASIYESEGDLDKGMKYREMAQKALPEVQGRDVVLVNGRPTVRIFFKDGTYEDVNDASPEAKTRLDDFGGYKRNLDERTGQYTGPQIPVTMTEAQIKQQEIARRNADIAAGNLNLSGRRFAWEQEQGKRPQIVQGQDGFVVVQPGPAGALPTGVPLTTPDGQPIKPRTAPPPQYVVDGLSTNAKNLGVIEKALASLETDAGKSATGWKGFAPAPVLNRLNPEGVETRADIADIGSLTIHSRSGAAVTAAEFPRLQPFIPTATDDTATVKKKLKRMAEIIKEESGVLGAFYPDAAKTVSGAMSGVSTSGGRAATGTVGGAGKVLKFDANGNPVK